MAKHVVRQIQKLADASKTVVYFVDDRCPTCQEPDRSELDHVRELCRYAFKQGVKLKGIVIQPGNTNYRYLTEMLRDVSPNHELNLPAMFYRGSWYQHAEDMLDTIQHVSHEAEEEFIRQAAKEVMK